VQATARPRDSGWSPCIRRLPWDFTDRSQIRYADQRGALGGCAHLLSDLLRDPGRSSRSQGGLAQMRIHLLEWRYDYLFRVRSERTRSVPRRGGGLDVPTPATGRSRHGSSMPTIGVLAALRAGLRPGGRGSARGGRVCPKAAASAVCRSSALTGESLPHARDNSRAGCCRPVRLADEWRAFSCLRGVVHHATPTHSGPTRPARSRRRRAAGDRCGVEAPSPGSGISTPTSSHCPPGEGIDARTD
jgi:hypothetical protein